MSNNAKIIVGIAAAAAVGAAIGLIFAPEKGSDLRKKVKKNANSLADDLLNLLQKGENRVNDLVGDAESRAKSWKNKAKDDFEEASDVAKGTVKTLQRDLASAI